MCVQAPRRAHGQLNVGDHVHRNVCILTAPRWHLWEPHSPHRRKVRSAAVPSKPTSRGQRWPCQKIAGRAHPSMRETASRFFSVILRNLSVCTFLMMIQMGIANTPSALGGHEACTYQAECSSRYSTANAHPLQRTRTAFATVTPARSSRAQPRECNSSVWPTLA